MPNSVLGRACLVLNRSWQPIGQTSVRSALLLLFSRCSRTGAPKARALNPGDMSCHDLTSRWLLAPIGALQDAHVGVRFVATPTLTVRAPEAIVLDAFAGLPPASFKSRSERFNRKRMYVRDGFCCVYCGAQASSDVTLTVDHVVPLSRGGSTSFQNCVTACYQCNIRKANRSIKEAGLSFRRGVRLEIPDSKSVQRFRLKQFSAHFQELVSKQSDA